jgi:DUF218 domain
MRPRNRRLVSLLIVVLLLCGSIAALRAGMWADATTQWTEELAFERRLSSGDLGHAAGFSCVAYVLGGGQESLLPRLRTAGHLFATGAVGRILVLHRPGITEFSAVQGRNLTNDEWVVRHLVKLGVAAERIEFVSVPSAAFSTLAEARVVSGLVRSTNARCLVLVSSRHHTKRVMCSFSHFNRDNRLDLYVYGADERVGLFEQLSETVKLLTYRYLALPLDRVRGAPGIRAVFTS